LLPVSLWSAQNYCTYEVNGIDVAVPHIDCGKELLVSCSTDDQVEIERILDVKIMPAILTSKAAVEFAAKSNGNIFSANGLLPKSSGILFNKAAGFAGPNCYSNALVSAGLLPLDGLRHLSTDETEHLIEMYFDKVDTKNMMPGDIIVYNSFDHMSFYLGNNLVFHKKSYLKEHLYRVCLFDKVYEEEPNEWKPHPMYGYNPFSNSTTIRKMTAYRKKSSTSYSLGEVSDDLRKKIELITYILDNIVYQSPKWHGSRELGYFTERLMEDLVRDFADMSKSNNLIVEAFYHQISSIRDQMNQSIENELLSSPHSQSNANQILKEVWFPQNEYSKTVVSKLLAIYKRPVDEETVLKVMETISKAYDKSPLLSIKR
jgi:cell wall-associated NlpC family hydrolase